MVEIIHIIFILLFITIAIPGLYYFNKIRKTKSWIKEGKAYRYANRHKDALQVFNKAIKLNPQNETAWKNKGFELNTLNRNEESLDAFDKVVEINPADNIGWTGKGIALTAL
jgi:tetratricopeptide (TPR) repeat protein